MTTSQALAYLTASIAGAVVAVAVMGGLTWNTTRRRNRK